MSDGVTPDWLRTVPRYVWPSRDARSPLPPESIMVRLADVVEAYSAFLESQKRQHKWQFYMNGTFCERCGVAIGTGGECR